MVLRFMQKHHELHWKEEKRILMYLQGTLHYVVLYSSRDIISILGYTVDYDCVGDALEIRCILGYIVYVGLSLISWNNKKLRSIYLTSYEHNCRESKKALAKETMWIRHVLTELGLVQKFPTELRYDN